VLQVATSGCNPNSEVAAPSTTDQCAQSNWFALRTMVEAKPDVVIVAQNTGQTAAGFSQIAAKLKSIGVKKIIFAGPTPHWKDDLPHLILTRLWLNPSARTEKGIDKTAAEVNARLLAEFKQSDSVALLDIMGVFCDKQGCLTYLGKDRKTGITSYDYGHLTPIASDYLAKHLLVKAVTGESKP
jgi:hypothetical protein